MRDMGSCVYKCVCVCVCVCVECGLCTPCARYKGITSMFACMRGALLLQQRRILALGVLPGQASLNKDCRGEPLKIALHHKKHHTNPHKEKQAPTRFQGVELGLLGH